MRRNKYKSNLLREISCNIYPGAFGGKILTEEKGKFLVAGEEEGE